MRNMAYTTFIVLCIAASSVLCAPADNDQLDKATVNDVAVNSVSEEKKADAAPAQSEQSQPSAPQSTIQITGITTGANQPAPVPGQDQPFKPQRAGSMFARFIDDIFQIPINVLQNVAKLITSPFQRKSPEVVAVVS